MNIGANVSSRAEKTFSALVEDFRKNEPKTKVDSFLYVIERAEGVWAFSYMLEKSWISKVYKLKVSYSFPVNLPDEDIVWDHWKKRWKSKEKESTSLTSELNCHTEMKSLIRTVDFEQVNASIRDQQLTINLVPVPGCFVWTLIPPMHYFVRLRHEEYSAMEKIPLLLKNICGNIVQRSNRGTWQPNNSDTIWTII